MQALPKAKEEDVGTFAASEAHHTVEAFYQVALKQFVDDFAIHAVEQALLVKIKNLFAPGSIFELEDELIANIAGETEESQIERESSEAKLRMLKALDILKRLDRGHTQSMPTVSNLPNARLTLVDSHKQDASILSGGGPSDKPSGNGTSNTKEDIAVALSQPGSLSKNTQDDDLASSVVNPAATCASNVAPRAQRQRPLDRERRKRRMTDKEKQQRRKRRIRRLS